MLGWCSFGLGAVGAFVPGLPTVPLMLVALWAFSRSSQRFHDWLYSHRVFGPPLQQWHEHGIVPLRAKVVAIATMVVSLVWMFFFTDMAVGFKVSALILMAIGAGYILTRRSKSGRESGGTAPP